VDQARAYFFLGEGQALIKKGQGFYGLAQENLEKSLNFDSENYETLCALSSLLIHAENPKSDFRLGKKYLEQAIAIKPELPSAYFNLANLLSIKVSNPEKDYRRAVACYLKA
jgi:tetratricopeptide (TPR) repeat protein